MNSFQIKVLAIVCMVIDHVGLFFFPHILASRVIGRFAFPLFAWLIANGARHTRDIYRYLMRLFILAVAAQIPFWFANQLIGSPRWYFDVVFTLCFGLLAILAIQRAPSRALQAFLVILCASCAACLNADYGAAGVLSIAAFYVFSDDFRYLVLSQAVLLGIAPLLVSVLQASHAIDLSRFYLSSSIEYMGLLSLLVIRAYNGERGRKEKYLFYVFYFLQYMALLGVKLLLG